jgi:hypothetical protein
MARERESGGQTAREADRQPERKRLPASQEEQTVRQADTITGAGREAGRNKDRRKINEEVSEGEKKRAGASADRQRGRWTRRETQANSQIRILTT